jgi:hypothetical protein
MGIGIGKNDRLLPVSELLDVPVPLVLFELFESVEEDLGEFEKLPDLKSPVEDLELPEEELVVPEEDLGEEKLPDLKLPPELLELPLA